MRERETKNIVMGKQTCSDCHFFVKESRGNAEHPVALDVTAEERAQAKRGDFSWKRDCLTLSCHFAVWDEGYEFDQRQLKDVIAGSATV